MINWIQAQKWQASALISAFSLLLFGGLDLLLLGPGAIWLSAVLSISVFFSIRAAWISLSLISLGFGAALLTQTTPGPSALIALVAVMLAAAFANRLQRNLVLLTSGIFGLAAAANALLFSNEMLNNFGFYSLNNTARGWMVAVATVSIIGLNVLAWLLGRLLATRSRHVGTSFDRAVAERTQAKLALEIAEQNERFEIARDISELVIQRVSATISIAEGGLYAVQADPSSATRVLQKATDSARSAHSELRRLFDMLNKLKQVSAAPPKLDDLEPLVVVYRELGFNISLRHEGPRFDLIEGAELAIYRIAFDALENVRKHAPADTDVSVDFSWTNEGLQLLVKDNGVEVANRGLPIAEIAYNAEEDRKALTETIRGAGITAMSERAALYQGSVEATRVPGVGFTVSAIFPRLKELSLE